MRQRWQHPDGQRRRPVPEGPEPEAADDRLCRDRQELAARQASDVLQDVDVGQGRRRLSRLLPSHPGLQEIVLGHRFSGTPKMSGGLRTSGQNTDFELEGQWFESGRIKIPLKIVLSTH